MSFTDNISSVTISRSMAEQLQHKKPLPRKGAKQDSDTPNDSEVQSMAVDQNVWSTAREQAERIAATIVRDTRNEPQAELDAKAMAKVRSIAAKLIVIEDEETVTVYNNLNQASKARAIKKAGSKAKPAPPVTE